ncbi:MAG: hypothetical protein A4E32_00759 [Methanomassiliicoccales archaeon PtaU1.Bin124]|nr:MAG: hypothetical protein A4E32_00759 [Methanomassiliicoccales archaeon PtaU1.Bin124]
MKQRCISCDSQRLRTYDAMVAPFLAQRIWNVPQKEAHLLSCKDCGMTFFVPRLTDEEVGLLYHDYRGEEYQRARQTAEPGYTPECNASLQGSEEALNIRKTTMASFLKKHMALDKVRSVLDYGGDRGQFICDELGGAERYVYDISGVEPIAGVNRFVEGARTDYDLMMCVQVLEHISYPKEMLAKIKRIGNEGTMFYFEVPWEFPLRTPAAGMKGKMEQLVISSPFLYNAYRRMTGDKFRMHEHINYFDERSLQNLLANSGFKVVALERVKLKGSGMDTTVISCLARTA